ncbi:hypothetical protein FF125_18160 [Aureibaculum algae]|uniref:Uncharacterized protein n=1 Tax=Aureibaculum algae TaxID=2584122 RepID=A0A5B7TZR4_9FLAO|nr:hypothetical protein [Aureibaculum algae]QCX40277.1 hypothetical protein FF125_18160 [Aureibaculum algae]
MENLNYIKHLNGILELFSKDNRLNPSHISLYMALFQIWNNYRFKSSFYINRSEVMDLSKLGSKTTYHRCIKELSSWKYILYQPSHNPFQGSKIRMFYFGTSYEPSLDQSHTNIGTSYEYALVSEDKHIQTGINKTNKNKLDQPKTENEVIDFFKKENGPELEAKKFYNHYQGIGWRVGGKTKIVDWQATARNWMLKANEIKQEKTVKAVSQNTDNLKTATNKNYNEPL